MCRPSQTPHLTMSSARIGPARPGLGAKRRGGAPLPTHGISKITLKVVVFHLRPEAPTYPTPLKSFHKVGLESSSTDRKSTRLNSSHSQISYAVFCLKKKTQRHKT